VSIILTWSASAPHNTASYAASQAVRDQLDWPGDLLKKMVEAKAKEAYLLQVQASGQGAVYNPGAMKSALATMGVETSYVPPMAMPPGPDPTRVPLTLGCRRKSGPEYLRAVFLDQACKQFFACLVYSLIYISLI
jgi:hypothetical protein